MSSPFPGGQPAEARGALSDDALRDAPIACHELDIAGNVIWVNSEWCRLVGLDAGQVLGHPIWEFVAPEERERSRAAVTQKLSTESPLAVFERPYSRPDGSTLALEIHERYRRGPNGEILGIRSFLLDITARKRAENALRSVQEELELRIRERTQELELLIDFLRREMDERRLAESEHRKLEAQVQYSQRLESMGVLAGGVAHKFNNLLTSIMGYTSMAAMELPRKSRVQEHLDQVLDAAKSAAELTQQMLAYSGRGQFVLESLDISRIVEGTARLLESMLSKKAHLVLELAATSPPIEADAAQIRQVLINLATNASDALADRAGEIAIRTGVMWAEAGELPSLHAGRATPAGLYAYLEVADTGCGIDPETLAKIFDPFFTTKFTGRGLGLPAVLGIVRAHRGSIRVASTPGQGTVVRAFFPTMEEAEPEPPAATAPESALWTMTGTVLVVDDEEPILLLAKAVLEEVGLTVLTARDGNQAVEVFRDHGDRIHAVLLDVTMPGMDGTEVFRHFHQARPDIRVILCSGYNEHEVSSRLGDDRPAAFLRKPYEPRELLALLSTLW